MTAALVFTFAGWFLAALFAGAWLAAHKNFHKALILIKRPPPAPLPHFQLSELRASAERMNGARLGETVRFRHFLPFRPSAARVLDSDCMEIVYMVTKDVP